jgi:hypothetical protein
MRAGVAWGSPIFPSASRRRLAHPPLLIPKRLDEGGDGLGVADLPQRLRRRLAHIAHILIPKRLDEGGDGWGSPICPSASAAAWRTPILILERLDEGGDGLGVADLPQRPRRRPAHLPLLI